MNSATSSFWQVLANKRWPRPLGTLKPLIGQAALLFGYKYKLSKRRLVSAWLHGFFGDKNILYDFDRFSYKTYVSDFQRNVRSARINRTHAHILNDKIVFSYLIQGLGGRAPEVWAEMCEGRFVNFEAAGDATLKSLLGFRRRAVIKPRAGSGGSGFYLVEAQNRGYSINGRAVGDLPDFGSNYISHGGDRTASIRGCDLSAHRKHDKASHDVG